MSKEKEFDFKNNIDRLKEIVEKISDDVLSLEESLALYEEGKKIVNGLNEALTKAEEKVEKIVDIK